MSKNKDRKPEHKNKKKLTYHQEKMIDRAIEEIKKYEASKESKE